MCVLVSCSYFEGTSVFLAEPPKRINKVTDHRLEPVQDVLNHSLEQKDSLKVVFGLVALFTDGWWRLVVIDVDVGRNQSKY